IRGDCGWRADRTSGDFELRRREDREDGQQYFFRDESWDAGAVHRRWIDCAGVASGIAGTAALYADDCGRLVRSSAAAGVWVRRIRRRADCGRRVKKSKTGHAVRASSGAGAAVFLYTGVVYVVVSTLPGAGSSVRP